MGTFLGILKESGNERIEGRWVVLGVASGFQFVSGGSEQFWRQGVDCKFLILVLRG